jgi:hypothetical protein
MGMGNWIWPLLRGITTEGLSPYCYSNSNQRGPEGMKSTQVPQARLTPTTKFGWISRPCGTANLWVSQKRTSAAEAVKHRLFTARLKPCPSYRDAFSFSFFAVATRQQSVQNVPSRLEAVKHVCRALRSTVSSPRLQAPSKLAGNRPMAYRLSTPKWMQGAPIAKGSLRFCRVALACTMRSPMTPPAVARCFAGAFGREPKGEPR